MTQIVDKSSLTHLAIQIDEPNVSNDNYINVKSMQSHVKSFFEAREKNMSKYLSFISTETVTKSYLSQG